MNRIMMTVEGEPRPLAMGPRLVESPIDHSRVTGWAGPPIERHRMEPWQGDTEMGPLSGERGLLVYTSGAVHIQATLNGRDMSRRVEAGSIRVLSGDDRPRYRRISGEAEVTVVHLPDEWLERALGPRSNGVFARTGPVDDDGTLYALAGELVREMDRHGSSGPLFIESLSLAFVSYAARRLGRQPTSRAPKSRGFTQAQRKRLRDFISSRLRDDLTLTELSSVVGLGPRHFSARFKQEFGCSPYRFVLDRKLSEAARLLSTTELDVAEVAYQVGFCSQSHFTAMFRKAFGVTPGRYAISRRRSVS